MVIEAECEPGELEQDHISGRELVVELVYGQIKGSSRTRAKDARHHSS
jgi:hypothetical protein